MARIKLPTGLTGRTVGVSTTGAFRLVGEDGNDLTPKSRKARALIAYLWRQPGHAETRAVLTAMLWEDRGEEQARQSLRQALYELRALTGETPPLLSADRTAVRMDGARLRALPASGGTTPTATTFAADLDGVSPTFDRWLQEVRQRSRVEEEPRRVHETPAAAAPGRRGKRLVAAVTGLGLVIAAGLAIVAKPNLDPRRLILVAPLAIAPSDAQAQRLSENLRGDLSRAVLGRDARLEFADEDTIARRRADFLLGGKVATVGGEVHAILSIKAPDRTDPVWSHDYVAPVGDLADLRLQISTQLGAVMVCALGERGASNRLGGQEIALYLEACSLRGVDPAAAIPLLHQLVRRAPRFAPGWTTLAISLAEVSTDAEGALATAWRREAATAATRGLSLDPRQGDAYYARALLLPGLTGWLARERIVAAGLAVEADNAQLQTLHASDLADVGYQAESLIAFAHAAELDPLLPGKTAALVRALTNAGEVDQATAAVQHMQAVWPDNTLTWHARFALAARVGDPQVALAMLNDDPRMSSISPKERAAWRAFLRARASPTPDHVASAIAELRARARAGEATSVQLVSDLTLLGRPDKALDVALGLPRQLESDFWFRSFLQPLRADPRFMKVARTQGLLPVWRATNRWPDFCADPSTPYNCPLVAAREDRKAF